MKKIIKLSITAIITMLLCLVIAPSVFASDTVYSTTDVTGGVRIDSVTTTETKLVIPDEIDGKVVVELALQAFTGTTIEEITIPATVTGMNDYIDGAWNSSLYGMEYLTKVTFADGMRVVPERALAGCTGVTEVVLPESVTTISNEAFRNCSSLTTINLPDSITSIGASAFYNCSSLGNVELPESLNSIGESAFSNCTKFTEISLPEGLTTIGVGAFVKTKISEITIPAAVTEMNGYIDNVWNSSFYGMDYLTKVTFADGMRIVPERALAGCLYVTEVVLPESVTSISNDAFRNCSALKTINLPDSITSIGDSAFFNCQSLTSISLPDSLISIGNQSFEECIKITEIVLPENITSLGVRVFYNTKISEIIIPANMETMNGLTSFLAPNGWSADHAWYSSLYGMSYLTKVTFADGMRVIPERALSGCPNVTEVVLPESATSISNEAFNTCSALKTINLPDSIVSIGDSAFYNCQSLTSISLPDSLTSIGNHAFEECIKITEIVLPENITSLGVRVFYNTKISEIIIPANMETMNGYTSFPAPNGWAADHAWYSSLYGMPALTKVTFADGMRVLPERALAGCTYLKEVVVYDCNTSLEAINTDAETNGYKLTVLPCEEYDDNLVIKEDSTIVVDNENMQTTIEINSTYADIIAQIENKNTVITNANGETINPDTVVGTGCVIIINNIVQYNIIINCDVDGNGEITASDARLALRASAQLDNLEGVYAQAANIDGNDDITASDARKILRKSAGLE